MGGCLGSIRSEGHTMGARCAASAWQDWRSGPISGGQSPVSRSGVLDRARRGSLAGPSGDVRELELIFKRFRRWVEKDVFARLFRVLSGDPDFEYALIDGTIIRVHQHGTGAKGGPPVRRSVARAAV